MSEDQVRGLDGRPHSLSKAEESMLAKLAEAGPFSFDIHAGKGPRVAQLNLLRLGLIAPVGGFQLTSSGTQVATILAQREATNR